MLGQKKNQAVGNTVRNNFAHSFDFKADAAVQAENNQAVTEAGFNQRLAELARDIDQRFGERHPTAKRPRLEAAPPRTSLSDPTIRFTFPCMTVFTPDQCRTVTRTGGPFSVGNSQASTVPRSLTARGRTSTPTA